MQRFQTTQPPICPSCGKLMVRIGAMSKMGMYPMVFVFKCEACGAVVSIEPDN